MKGRNRLCSLLLLLTVCVSLCGCKAAELEDRSFPMLVSVRLSDTNEAQLSPVFANEWSDINSYLDYNHLKVVLIEEKFIRDEEAYHAFLEELQREETFPRNAYVCITAYTDELDRAQEALAVDIGTYIENMLQTKEKTEHLHLPTIGDLMDEKENRMRIWNLPILTAEDGQITIMGYFQMKYGSPSALRESEYGSWQQIHS
jgi:hypothetical protein